MKPRTLVILALVALFVLGVGAALWREVVREEAVLASSISGTVSVTDALLRSGRVDIVRTDRMALILVEPSTGEAVALTFVTPLVPPQTIRVGQDHVRQNAALSGEYLVVGITDKDGEIFHVAPGEVYGRSAGPVALGSEEFSLELSQPYQGGLFNEATAGPASAPGAAAGAPGGAMHANPLQSGADDADPAFSVSGTIVVTPGLAGNLSPQDRLVILLFDPDVPRPVAFNIVPNAQLPMPFTITLPPQARGRAKPGYFLRVVSDKNNDPFGAAEGELVGRSAEPVPLGTSGLVFTLDQPYRR